MMTGMAILLLSAVFVADSPCEKLTDLKFDDARIVSAVVVPEGPPPAHGGFPVSNVLPTQYFIPFQPVHNRS